jgi:hypothetical protein
MFRWPHEVAGMNRHAQECLDRAAECALLAEATSDLELKAYLTRLASSWVQVARETEDAQAKSESSPI